MKRHSQWHMEAAGHGSDEYTTRSKLGLNYIRPHCVYYYSQSPPNSRPCGFFYIPDAQFRQGATEQSFRMKSALGAYEMYLWKRATISIHAMKCHDMILGSLTLQLRNVIVDERLRQGRKRIAKL
jgi:hypothetical protein